ncbi:MAG: SUMF1/EgtB/PvdO family nonheme iron enzyme, partial [Rhizobiaceae bacterium]
MTDKDRFGRRVFFQPVQSWLGTSRPVHLNDGEAPKRIADLKAFAIDACAVTTKRFEAFVVATGYATTAEKAGWSFVFRGFVLNNASGEIAGISNDAQWWVAVRGASWKHPFGAGSSPDGLENYPVTHVSQDDARAMAQWTGGRLPDEAEWEHAARGGVDDRRYPWGDEEPDDSTVFCNIWQGQFPHTNTMTDGY